MKKNWQIKKLGEICNFVGGGTPSKNNPDFWNGDIPWASIKDIKGQYLNRTSDYITDVGLKKSATNLANPNEIILATRINPGRPIITKIKTSINQDLKIVRPKIEIHRDFLYYLFLNIENDIIKLSNGTTVLGITLNSLNEIDIHLPPLQTQQAIVSKIEELFSELDKGIEDLKTAQQQLKTYRQSVLKWAFEGKLTNENVKDGELPEGWETLKIKDVSKVINGDRSKNYPSRSHYVNEGIPFISAGTIDENKINKTDINYITESKFDSLRSGKLEKRDLIYCLRGSLGKCAIYPFSKGAISSSLCIVRASELIELEYLFYYLLSPLANNEILKYDNGTAQPNLSAKDFSNFEIPFASKDEQHQIVQEIESRLSVADKMEESITQSLQQAEALRQSILKKAFSGELV